MRRSHLCKAIPKGIPLSFSSSISCMHKTSQNTVLKFICNTSESPPKKENRSFFLKNAELNVKKIQIKNTNKIINQIIKMATYIM